MYTTYRLSTEELNDDFLLSLKTLFKGKTIEIAICEVAEESEDETRYLLRDPANRQRLMTAIENVRLGRTHQAWLDEHLEQAGVLVALFQGKLEGVMVDG